MDNNLILTTSINIEMIDNIIGQNNKILDLVLLSVDDKPLEISNGLGHIQSRKESRKAVMTIRNYDVVGLVVTVVPKKVKNKAGEIEHKRKIYILAKDLVKIKTKDGKEIISLNGNFEEVPEEIITEAYKNFSDWKSLDYKKIDEFLEVTQTEPTLKAYLKLSKYFTEENFKKNNNVFSLLEHKAESHTIAKKVLIKSMVAWEIRK